MPQTFLEGAEGALRAQLLEGLLSHVMLAYPALSITSYDTTHVMYELLPKSVIGQYFHSPP